MRLITDVLSVILSSCRTDVATLIVLTLCGVIIYTVPHFGKAKDADLRRTRVVGASSGFWLSELQARLLWTSNGVSMLYKAYGEHPHEILRAPVDQLFFILPPSYIDELKSLPETVLNPTHAIVDYFLGSYTTLDLPLFGHVLWSSIRNLTQQLNNLVKPLAEECSLKLSEEIANFQEWTLVTPHPHILQVVASMNARIFVGERLCRNQLWLDTSIDFSRCVFLGAGYLKLLPWFFRPIVSLFLPYTRRIKLHHRNARKLLIPEILRRRAESAKEGQLNTQLLDMIQILERVSSADEKSPEQIVTRQLGLTFAATHGTTNHIVNVIYDLAARWIEYGPEIRREIEGALVESGGVMSKSTLAAMSKLDSFMKESQRIHPGSALSFFRKLMVPHKLSNGQTIPCSSIITVAAGPMALSSEYHSSPDIFDGLRFHRMRKNKDTGLATSHQFTTTSLGNLMFGHGKFACPGRFYADVQSKIILAQIMLRYDLKLVDGSDRPRSISFADASIPDPKQKVLFRVRQNESVPEPAATADNITSGLEGHELDIHD